MNGRAARLIRQFCRWARASTQAEVRLRKRAWKAMSHRAKGRARASIDTAMTSGRPDDVKARHSAGLL